MTKVKCLTTQMKRKDKFRKQDCREKVVKNNIITKKNKNGVVKNKNNISVSLI